jgi:hypothetical protein
LRAAEVTVELALGVEPPTRRLEEVALGRHVGTVELPLPGVWTARVAARIGDFEGARVPLRAARPAIGA